MCLAEGCRRAGVERPKLPERGGALCRNAVVATERRDGLSWSEMNPLRLFPVKTTRSFDSARPAVSGKVCSPFALLRMTELENNAFAEVSDGKRSREKSCPATGRSQLFHPRKCSHEMRGVIG